MTTSVEPEDGKTGEVVPMDGGDQIQVGDIRDAKGVAIGRGAAVYQGLTVEQVAALVVELKKKDQPTVWDGRVPYLGLNAYQESDAEFFFGREELVKDLLGRLEQARFITIAGPSGSGKSSVARAGLFHALRGGRLERSETWRLATMQPKGEPIKQLALAIDRVAGKLGSVVSIREDGVEDPLALHILAETLLTDDKRQRFVLLVDQFEELFTQTRDEGERSAFVDLLTSAAGVEDGRVIVVISLRSDFVSNCASYDELREMISQEFQLVGAMKPRDLAKAITLPSLGVGAEIEPALVKQIIDDMKGEPGALPLMSFAMLDLFKAQKTTKGKPLALTLEEYLQRGGIESALERHANSVFESLTEGQQVLAKGVFSKLITVGEGGVDTRRAASFEELVPVGTDREAIAILVRVLAAEGARLVTTSGMEGEKAFTAEGVDVAETAVTIAHEKLIDAWPWLQRLIDENRELIALHNVISDDAKKWEKEEDDGYLLRGGRLNLVEERLNELEPDLDGLSQHFIQASIDERQRLTDEKEAQRQRTMRILAGAMVVALGLAAIAFFFFALSNQSLETANIALTAEASSLATSEASEANALTAQETAEAESTRAFEQAQLAEARELAAQAETAIERNDRKSAYLLALQAVDSYENDGSPASEADVALTKALTIFHDRATLRGHAGTVYSAIFDHDGSRILTAGEDGTARLWDERGALITVLEGHEGGVRSAVFNHNSSRILTAGCDERGEETFCTSGTAKLWDSEGVLLNTLKGHTDLVRSAVFNHDGSRILTASDDGTAKLWDGDGTFITTLEGHARGVASAIFNHDSSRILTASWDGTARLWDDQGTPITVLEGHSYEIYSAVFNHDGSRILTAGCNKPDSHGYCFNGDARLWDERGALITVLEGHSAGANSAVFNHNSSRILTAGCDERDEESFCTSTTARIWDSEGVLLNTLVQLFKSSYHVYI